MTELIVKDILTYTNILKDKYAALKYLTRTNK